jgi:nitroreductase
MEFNQVVMTRRSVFKFEDKTLHFDDILPLLTAAVMAPNHHLTQPWQFLWVGEQTRVLLADRYAQARALKKLGYVDAPEFTSHKAAAVARFMAIPAVLMVACRIDDNEIIAEEDYAATCCAVQNLLLAATDRGLGAQWSTHPMIRDAEVLNLLGLDVHKERLVAMIYVGYPKVVPPAPPRKAVGDCVRLLP